MVATALKTPLALALGFFLLLPLLLPTPQFETRLFSDDWGAANIIDPSFCMTQIEGQTPRLAMFPKIPAVAHTLDRLALAAQYLAWGLLLPVIALLATLRYGVHAPKLISFGLLGAAPAWFQWSLNPAFVTLRQTLAEAWLARWPLEESQFVWLDNIALVFWLAGGAVLAGGAIFLATQAAARFAGLDERRLARDLVPLAAIVLFLGLTQTTALYLRGEWVNLDWLPGFRAALLVLAIAVSGWLGLQDILKVGAGRTARKAVACLLWTVPLALAASHGWAMYFHWIDRYHV